MLWTSGKRNGKVRDGGIGRSDVVDIRLRDWVMVVGAESETVVNISSGVLVEHC